MLHPTIAIPLLVAILLSAVSDNDRQTPGGVASHPASRRDTLPTRHAVRGQHLTIQQVDIEAIEVSSQFRYAGGQRFVLRGVVDAEQHLFVLPDSNRRSQRFLWIQVEHFLPGAAGSYNYDADSLIAHSGRNLRVQVRRYSSAPDPTSDRGALYGLMLRAGYQPPERALRARWIALATADARSEVMIIYAEASAAVEDPTGQEVRDIIERARAAFRLTPLRAP